MNINEALILLNKDNSKHYKINKTRLNEANNLKFDMANATIYHPDGTWDDGQNGPDENKKYVYVEHGVTELPDMFCKDLINLQGAVLANSLKIIGDEAFSGCTRLEDINTPPNLERIGNEAFIGAMNLRSFVIPDKIKTIPQSAFQGCYSLQFIKLPKGLAEIQPYAFLGCPLTYLNIPESVTTIGECAFKNTGLRKHPLEITLPKNLKILETGVFYNSNFFNIKFPEGLKIIKTDALAYTPYEQLIIPASVTTIEDKAFGNVSEVIYHVQKLTLPAAFNSEQELYRIGINPEFTEVTFHPEPPKIEPEKSVDQKIVNNTINNKPMSWADDLEDDEGNLDDEDE